MGNHPVLQNQHHPFSLPLGAASADLFISQYITVPSGWQSPGAGQLTPIPPSLADSTL
jgi:hypothetical protein